VPSSFVDAAQVMVLARCGSERLIGSPDSERVLEHRVERLALARRPPVQTFEPALDGRECRADEVRDLRRGREEQAYRLRARP
jgi:hypothetical protein